MDCSLTGNKKLLQCHYMWRKLLQHYEARGCVVEAGEFLQTELQPGKEEHTIPRLRRQRQQNEAAG